MYEKENHDEAGSGEFSQNSSANSAASADLTGKPEKLQSAAVIIKCAYCRKEFDRAATTAMPFCSSRCKQIDLGLWLNEVHGLPYENDPGIS